ncbi:MAG: hypothetical protein R3E08_13205, partial [Thiotrichaceae bacterium]
MTSYFAIYSLKGMEIHSWITVRYTCHVLKRHNSETHSQTGKTKPPVVVPVSCIVPITVGTTQPIIIVVPRTPTKEICFLGEFHTEDAIRR